MKPVCLTLAAIAFFVGVIIAILALIGVQHIRDPYQAFPIIIGTVFGVGMVPLVVLKAFLPHPCEGMRPLPLPTRRSKP